MNFLIEYTKFAVQKTLVYHTNEQSFDMTPRERFIDFDICINSLSLAVVNGQVIQLDGFCGLNKKMIGDFIIPESRKGKLKILYTQNYLSGIGSYRVNREEWSVHVNVKTGWVCIGDYDKKGYAVEFINNCVAVISHDQRFVSLWLHPLQLPRM